MSKIILNKEKCIGCGACQVVCPEYFEIGEDGKAKVKKEEIEENENNCVKEAIDGCPVQAIEIQK